MIFCKSISKSNFPFLNMEYSIFKKGKLRKITSDRKKEIGFCIDMYTICQLYTQLLRNIRQPKKNGKKSPAGCQDHVLGCMCGSFRS